MPDDLADMLLQRRPTPQRPLMGLTILAVEDSRFASEALRLLCHHSGARLRRADSLAHAHRHLLVYRPTVVIIDMGLPDGSGADLIRELHKGSPPVAVILAISGNPDTKEEALKAGAQAFLTKPTPSLAVFQSAILAELPSEMHPKGPRALSEMQLEPDALALRDDLTYLVDLIATPLDSEQARYAAQFLMSLASSADDDVLTHAAERLDAVAVATSKGVDTWQDLRSIAETLRAQVETSPASAFL